MAKSSMFKRHKMSLIRNSRPKVTVNNQAAPVPQCPNCQGQMVGMVKLVSGSVQCPTCSEEMFNLGSDILPRARFIEHFQATVTPQIEQIANRWFGGNVVNASVFTGWLCTRIAQELK